MATEVPTPDPISMTGSKVCVISATGAIPKSELAKELLYFAWRSLVFYMRICCVELVPKLPKTISGKICRVQLRAQEVERRGAGTRGEHEYFEKDFAKGGAVSA